jgi:hypothetical protein
MCRTLVIPDSHLIDGVFFIATDPSVLRRELGRPFDRQEDRGQLLDAHICPLEWTIGSRGSGSDLLFVDQACGRRKPSSITPASLRAGEGWSSTFDSIHLRFLVAIAGGRREVVQPFHLSSGFGLQTPDDEVEDSFGLVIAGLAGPDAPEEPHEQ